MVRAATSAGGGDAPFFYLGEVSCSEGRSGRLAVFSWTVGVGARAMGMSRGGIGSGLFTDLVEFLSIIVLQSGIAFGFYLRLLLMVCVLGFFEDVDKMFTGADDFPGLVDYCDRLYERHLGRQRTGIDL